MRRDHLDGLLTFLAVAESLSFAKAAARLGVSPAAASESIRRLEEAMGVRLLVRTTRSVGLTDAGRRCLERIDPAVNEMLEALVDGARGDAVPSGHLRLCAPRSASLSLLEPALPDFLAAYPEIDLEIAIDNGFADIRRDGFDAGIRYGDAPFPGMVAVQIGPAMPMAVVGAPAYLRSRGVPKHPRQLGRHECIRYRPVHHEVVDHWELASRGRRLSVEVRGRLVVNDALVALQAALDGLGLAYLARDQIELFVSEGRLVEVLAGSGGTTPGFFLYYPNRAGMTPRLEAFVDFMRNRNVVEPTGPRRRAARGNGRRRKTATRAAS